MGQKLNRADLLRSFIEKGGNKVTCEFIWKGKDSLAVKLTQAVSELRAKLAPEKRTVVFHKGLTPSDSWYSIEHLKEEDIPAFTDKETGQREWESIWKQTKID